MRRRSLGVHVAMKHRRRWTTALAMTAVLAVAIWLWLSRGESVSAVIAREGRPWLVVESATMERRFGGAILPSTYLVLRGAREWDPAIDPMSGTTLVYTADQSVRIYWRQPSVSMMLRHSPSLQTIRATRSVHRHAERSLHPA
jgi:hypothetical protein